MVEKFVIVVTVMLGLVAVVNGPQERASNALSSHEKT
jgi:hypothetical protein